MAADVFSKYFIFYVVLLLKNALLPKTISKIFQEILQIILRICGQRCSKEFDQNPDFTVLWKETTPRKIKSRKSSLHQNNLFFQEKCTKCFVTSYILSTYMMGGKVKNIISLVIYLVPVVQLRALRKLLLIWHSGPGKVKQKTAVFEFEFGNLGNQISSLSQKPRFSNQQHFVFGFQFKTGLVTKFFTGMVQFQSAINEKSEFNFSFGCLLIFSLPLSNCKLLSTAQTQILKQTYTYLGKVGKYLKKPSE